MFEVLIFIVVVFYIIKVFTLTNKDKGKLGEKKVNSKLNSKLNKSYKIYDDLTFRIKGGRTTQIDHIVISPYGIFVIETKNMKGWIFGSENQKKWTQVIYDKKNHFQNPLHQNYRHIKSISEILNVNEWSIHSIVVFVGDSVFKTEIPNNVFNNTQYISYIKSFNDILFDNSRIKQMTNIIEEKSIKNSNIHIEHINNLKNKKIIDKNVCKRCGSEMVERTNKNTNEIFLGCSNYPKCRNTEKI